MTKGTNCTRTSLEAARRLISVRGYLTEVRPMGSGAWLYIQAPSPGIAYTRHVGALMVTNGTVHRDHLATILDAIGDMNHG